jgi:RNA-binding protein YhbY
MTNGAKPNGLNVEVIEQIVSALTVAQIVTVNTLHAQGVIDRKHFAHAFARAIDALAPNPKNQLLVVILQVVKNACMQSGAEEATDLQAWLRGLLDKGSPSGAGG